MTSEQPVKLVLAWPSGTVIRRFEEVPYDSVEDFVQRMEEGYFEHIGVPRCAVSEEGNWLESYDLVHEDRVLLDGQYFSELGLPPGAHLVLVRSDRAMRDDAVTMTARTIMPGDEVSGETSGDGSDVAQHGSDGDSEDDGDVTVTLLDLAGNDMFPGVAIQVTRDASVGQLQRRVMDATGVVSPWFQGKHLVVRHWVHPFDDAYCYFMRIPQVRKQVGANRLQARVVRTLAACTD